MNAKLFFIALILFAAGCAKTATPAPTAAPTDIPTPIPAATVAPTNTPLPPTPTTAPTNTSLPPTNTPIPASPTATATNTRVPVTRAPTQPITPTATSVALKFAAPNLLEPHPGDTRILRRDAFVFKWEPVGDLAANECYQLTLRIVHLADPNRNYAEQKYLVDCNWAVGSGTAQFVVNGRPPAPNYDGLVDEANGKAGGIDSQEYLVQWTVQAVLNENGSAIPISPPSATGEFRLLSP